MRKLRPVVMVLVLVAMILPVTTLLALYQGNCSEVCTPNCPCSVPCDGLFGPTTCGAAGEACIWAWSDNTDLFSFLEPEQNMTPMNLAAPEATVAAPTQEIEDSL